MAIHFADQRPASEGPLDVAHNGGVSDNAPFSLEENPPADANEPLDASAAANLPLSDDEELLRQKNPLGYSITEPTEDEIDAAGDKATATK